MNYQSLKIDELKELLKNRGLNVTGRKQQLIQALINYDNQNDLSDSLSTEGLNQKYEEKEGSDYHNAKVEDNLKDAVDIDLKKKETETIELESNRVNPTICISDINNLTEQQRVELRRRKFGSCVPLTENQKRLSRMERFGIISEADKLRLRKARFGITSEADKIKLRKERFSTTIKEFDPEHEKKIQARKLRFGLK